MMPTEDFTDVTDEEDEEDEGGDDKSYFVMTSKAVQIAKEVKRSNGW